MEADTIRFRPMISRAAWTAQTVSSTSAYAHGAEVGMDAMRVELVHPALHREFVVIDLLLRHQRGSLA